MKRRYVTNIHTDEERVEFFVSKPFLRWSGLSGSWKVEDEIEATEVDEKLIYKSPEEPSHVAWVGLWKESDGSLKIRFAQITGNPGLEPSYAPWYGLFWEKYAGIGSWSDFCKWNKMREGPTNAIETTRVDYVTMLSHDGGETWENLGPGQDSYGYNLTPALASDGSLVSGGMSTIVCRDGRVVQTIDAFEWMKVNERLKSNYLLGIRESLDNGKTWSENCYIIPECTNGESKWSEENAMVELEDGRILVLTEVLRFSVF
jgi:hypothetical protein